MIGLDRSKREVQVAASVGDDGQQVTPPRTFGYDTLILAVGSHGNDFGTPGVGSMRSCSTLRSRLGDFITAW
jgi:NADH dehydrogenase